MKALHLIALFTFCTAYLGFATGCKQRRQLSELRVTNGKDDAKNTSVILYTIKDAAGVETICTGTFLTQSLLLTAGHCVTSGKGESTVEFADKFVGRADIYIHPQWLTLDKSTSPEQRAQASAFDLALVNFKAPVGVGSGNFPKFLSTTPKVGDVIEIVGFGANDITVLERSCVLSPRPSTGECRLLQAKRGPNGLNYALAYSFPESSSLCELESGANHFQKNTGTRGPDFAALSSKLFESFLSEVCDSDKNGKPNIGDRPFTQAGAGSVRRSGMNVIEDVTAGSILFSGVLSGSGTGIRAASGGGDSGGPLFIQQGGESLLAGVSHGGEIKQVNQEWLKYSYYVDITSAANQQWLKGIALEKGLTLPQLASSNSSASNSASNNTSSSQCSCLHEDNFGKTANGQSVNHWCVIRKESGTLVGFTDRTSVPVGQPNTDCSQDCPKLAAKFQESCGQSTGIARPAENSATATAAVSGATTATASQPTSGLDSRCRCGLWMTVYGETCAIVRPKIQWQTSPDSKFLVQAGSREMCGTAALCQQYFSSFLNSAWCPNGYDLGNQR